MGAGGESKTSAWGFAMAPHRLRALVFFSISLTCVLGAQKYRLDKEPSHQDGSFEYPQHMFWLRNNKNNF